MIPGPRERIAGTCESILFQTYRLVGYVPWRVLQGKTINHKHQANIGASREMFTNIQGIDLTFVSWIPVIPSLKLTEKVTKRKPKRKQESSSQMPSESQVLLLSIQGPPLKKTTTNFALLKVLLFNDSLVEFRGTLRDLCGPAAMGTKCTQHRRRRHHRLG